MDTYYLSYSPFIWSSASHVGSLIPFSSSFKFPKPRVLVRRGRLPPVSPLLSMVVQSSLASRLLMCSVPAAPHPYLLPECVCLSFLLQDCVFGLRMRLKGERKIFNDVVCQKLVWSLCSWTCVSIMANGGHAAQTWIRIFFSWPCGSYSEMSSGRGT